MKACRATEIVLSWLRVEVCSPVVCSGRGLACHAEIIAAWANPSMPVSVLLEADPSRQAPVS